MPDFSFVIINTRPHGTRTAHLRLVAPSNIRRALEARTSNCRATASVAESRQAGGAPALQRLPQPIRKTKREKRC